ncbi:MAG TPA: DUF3263 domain-containing protein [Microbacterium sp.]|nr:DUF3263 domain-containing protein [Microbacterium sp.]
MTPSALLAFERRHPGHPPGKEAAIIAELGIPPARFYQLLIRAARSIDGIRADPITARRVRAMVGRRGRAAA